MAAYLLTWNPKYYTISGQCFEEIAKRGFVDEPWSTGPVKRIEKGDRVFLLRQGVKLPRGIVGSGYVTRGHYRGKHWREKGKIANYVDVRWDRLIDADRNPALVLSTQEPPIPQFPIKVMCGGIGLKDRSVTEIEGRLRNIFRDKKRLKNSKQTDAPRFLEGEARDVSLTTYERNPEAELACLAQHGTACHVCRFDFEKTFGLMGKGFIHVHHHQMVSAKGGRYEIDPLKDLTPVCPNCHAMLHTSKPPLTISQLRNIVTKRRTG